MAVFTVSLQQASGVGDISLGDGTTLATLAVSAGRGPKGDGFTGGSYNASTGVVTFTSNDGIGFSTGDLRSDLSEPGPIGDVTPNTGAFTSLEATTADINGGTIDGTVIGGSTPAAISGTTGQFSTSLNVDGTITSDGLTVNGAALLSGQLRFNDTNYWIDNSGGTDISYRSGGTHQFYSGGFNQRLNIASNGDISFYEDTGTTPKFFWDASAERLGIGTSSPSSSLFIAYDSATANDWVDAGQGLTIRNNSATKPTSLKLTSVTAANGHQIVWGGGTGDSHLAFKNYNTERMRIDSSGNVGIGTSSPDAVLHVFSEYNYNGTDFVDSPHAIIDNGTITNHTAVLVFNSSGTDSANKKSGITGGNYYSNNHGLAFFGDISGKDRFATPDAFIDSSGNVGIGTSSPGQRLDVRGNSGANIGAQIKNDGTGRAILDLDSGGTSSTYVAFKNQGTQTARVESIPTINSLLFATGTTERMRIDSSGNVGIGTTSPDDPLEVSGSGSGLIKATRTATGGDSRITYENSSDSTRGQVRFNWAAQAFGAFEVFVPWDASNNQRLALQMGKDFTAFNTSEVERMRITSSGNVGIGTSSPGAKLHINTSSTAANVVRVTNATQDLALGVNSGAGGSYVFERQSQALRFGTGDTERMRIDSSGNVLVGTTSLPNGTTTGGSAFQALSGDRRALLLATTSSSGTMAAFFNSNGQVGTITTSGSATAYNTSSDYRLKEDVQPMVGASDRLMALKPVNFAWKADGSRVDGFLAHEAQEVVPEAVTGSKDAVDKDGNPEYQGIDQSKLVPLLTAALQDALKRIEALEAQINT